jgi:hypothetical protein
MFCYRNRIVNLFIKLSTDNSLFKALQVHHINIKSIYIDKINMNTAVGQNDCLKWLWAASKLIFLLYEIKKKMTASNSKLTVLEKF